MDRVDEEWNPGVGPHGAPRRHFRIVKLLGIGGFGSVYEALLERPDGFRKTVALKILHDEDVPPYVLRRFRDEAKLLGLLRDRAIVGVDVPTKLMDRWSIIMECVDGATASQVLKFIGPIPPRVALSIVGEIARALHKVYQLPGEDGRPIQLVHRDIKAANVSITREGDVKILDFGIARANFTARESSTLQNAGPDGTVGYIAPERFEGIEGPEGDIYSLGVTLYVMLTRVRPTHIDRRVDHPEAAMRSALEVAVSMCELEAARRPSAQEVHRTCRSLVERMPGPSIAEWAERVVPDAQEAAQRHLSMSEEGDKLGLVGTILTEEPSSKPILTAAPVTPTGTSRTETPRAESPSTGLRVRTARVRVPTGEVARPPRPTVTQDPTRPRPPVRSSTPSRPPGPPDRRSVPPAPGRTRTPVSPSRTRTPTGPLPSRTGPVARSQRERTDPLAARADVFRDVPSPARTPARREGTSPRMEVPPREGTSPRMEIPREGTSPRLEQIPVEPHWSPSQPASVEPLAEPRARPSRFVAAGLAGLLTAVGLLALLAVSVLWIAENEPELFEELGIDPALLEIPAWMIPGKEGLQPDPEAVPDEAPVAAEEPPPVPAKPRPAPKPAPAPENREAPPPGDVSELLPAAGGEIVEIDGKTDVRILSPGGVLVKVDGRPVLREDGPRSTSVNVDSGARRFLIVLPDGTSLERDIVVGGALGANLIEVRDGTMQHCRAPADARRCTQ